MIWSNVLNADNFVNRTMSNTDGFIGENLGDGVGTISAKCSLHLVCHSYVGVSNRTKLPRL